MTKRTINKKLLRAWVVENGKGSLEMLSFQTGCSFSLIQKLSIDGYESIPSLQKIESLCEVIGCELDDLFPKEAA